MDLINGKAVKHYLQNHTSQWQPENVESGGRVTISRSRSGNDSYTVKTGAARRTGAGIFLDPKLLRLTGDFTKVGNRMEATIDGDQVEKVADVIREITKSPFRPDGKPEDVMPKVLESNNLGKRKARGDEPAANLGTGLNDGEGMSADEVSEAIKGQDTAGFEVQTISKDDAARITGRPEARGYGGFFYQGKIYLVADNIGRGRVDELHQLLREEVGHGLLRTAEGMRQLQAVLDAGKLNLTEAEKSALRAKGYQENQLLDEFIAKSAAENRPWWKQAVDTIRAWLAKAGLANLSNDEVARLLVKNIRRAASGVDDFGASGLPEVAAGEAIPPGEDDDSPPAPDGYIATQYAGKEYLVKDRPKLTPSEMSEADAFAGKVFEDLKLPVVPDSEMGWKFVPDGFDHDAEVTMPNGLLDRITKQLETQGEQPGGEVKSAGLLNAIALNYNAGNLNGVFSTSNIYKLFQLTGGERSRRGVALRALKGSP
jgi:hypothetical protein